MTAAPLDRVSIVCVRTRVLYTYIVCIGVYAATNVCDTYAVNGQNGKTCIMRVIVSRTTSRSDEAKNFRREKT